MNKNDKISNWLNQTNKFNFAVYLIAASFITYFSMYAFRKPLSAGTFSDLYLFGIDYKIYAIFFQIIGYTISKFAGIKIIAELKTEQRIIGILVLIGISWISLLFFAIVPTPYNLIFLIFNGFPLGMIWGIVFSFLEGRKLTEILGAGLSSSFIVSSGVVKAIGRSLVINFGISEFWMPFLTGMIFIASLVLGVFLLSKIPPPNEEDIKHRTQRIPMDSNMRKKFFKEFSLGIILVTIIYVFLTIFRDVRDNFAVEIWSDLGFADRTDILATAEIPISIAVLIIIGSLFIINNNRIAFYLNKIIFTITGILLILTTYLFQSNSISPIFWMILNGFSMYLAYLAYHTFLFERWIAVFQIKSNIGFLMYIVDSFGYLGSSIIIFSKSFLSIHMNWLSFFVNISYLTGFVLIFFGIITIIYFLNKEKKHKVEIELQLVGENNG
ncbi:MAG: hypothetical protein IPM32_12655 [Ignavibacteriae bacterium]|nr:hypothetical protein [Ignavibacteriota bacterium]